MPHLLAAGRLIRAPGWEDIVRAFPEAYYSPAAKAFVRLLLDVAAGRRGEADVRQCVAGLHGAGLVRAMTWQHLFNSWNCAIKARYNAERRERLSPPTPHTVERDNRPAAVDPAAHDVNAGD